MHDPLPEGIRVQSSGLGLADKLLMLVRDNWTVPESGLQSTVLPTCQTLPVIGLPLR